VGLSPGTRLGPFEIVSPLGAGGMGEVYRASDVRLGRDVAIKILPAAFADDPERLARFAREARTLASLNHSSIAQIHGLEDCAIVMELVEGEDLSERIARGPIPIVEAVAIARQIAEALDAAHAAGIVHRDLKPGNIKVRTDGTVKVLDFGLAKALERTDPRGEYAAAATITSPAMTVRGVILGTAAYMSPEQAKGKTVDTRSDIWAFGCVLYEMLTATRAFEGEDVTDTIAAIVTKDPDWTKLPSSTPDSIRRLLRRCLAKPLQQRLRSIGDATLEMTDISESPSESHSSGAAPWHAATAGPTRGLRAATAVMVLLGVALAAWTAGRRQATEPLASSPVVRLSLVPSAADAITVSGNDRDLAISPDGSAIAYVGGNGTSLIVRRLDRTDAVHIDGAGLPHNPFFSSDGKWVGFVDGLSVIKKVPVVGGAIETVAHISYPGVTATWYGDSIVFTHAGQLFRVSAHGGVAEAVTPPPGAGQPAFFCPAFLPGGNVVLVATWLNSATGDDAGIGVVDLRTHTYKRLVPIRSPGSVTIGLQARFVPPDHLVYRATIDAGGEVGTLHAVGFDPNRLETEGIPVPIDESVFVNSFGGHADFDVAANGTLVFVDRSARPNARRLVWVARDGREEPIDLPARAYTYPSMSPDGRHVAFDIRDQENDTWVWDSDRDTLRRLTFDPGFDQYAVWTHDQRHLVHMLDGSIFWQAPDGSGRPELLAERHSVTAPYAFSKDDRFLVFREDSPATGHDLLMLSLADRKVQPLLNTPANELNAEISPDGRWLAFESDESGVHEIYVRPFPDVNAGRWQVSTAGGRTPLWSRDGRELYFLGLDSAMMAARVETTTAFVSGAPVRLFAHHNYVGGASSIGRTYDQSPDGRFLMIKPAPSPNITVVLNWSRTLIRPR
jgi:serine/threonine-protein kinase